MAGVLGYIGNVSSEIFEKSLKNLCFTGREKVIIENYKDSFFGIVRHKLIGKKITRSEDGSKVIFMDGEVFDYELDAKNLIRKGCNFDESSFEAYCLCLFEQEGSRGIKKLNGSFSISIYDLAKKEVHIFVDRFASRPIYYHNSNKNLLFSTKLSPISIFPKVKKTLNLAAVYDFFTFHRVLGNKTYFKEISLLGPGQYLMFNSKGLRIKDYNPLVYSSEVKSQEYYSNELADLIIKSVKRRISDNYNYGLLLSGGLDSRAIVAASDVELKCFTYADSLNREVKIAKKIAVAKNYPHYFLQRKKNHFMNLLDESVEIGDGRFKFDHAWGLGLLNNISAKCDILLHGFLFDTLFKEWGIPEQLEGVSEKGAILEDSLYSQNIGKIFKKPKKYSKILNLSVDNVLKEGESKGAKKANKQFNHFSFHSAYNQADFLCSLHNRHLITERFISLDKDLIALYLKMPIEYRKDSKIFKNALKKIDKEIYQIKNANNSIYQKIPLPLKQFIRKFQRFLNEFKLFRNISLFNPSHTQSSWSNFSQLIVTNKKLREKILSTINDSKSINPEIFDVSYINKLFNDHVNGKKDYMPELFLVLTFGVWYKKYGV